MSARPDDFEVPVRLPTFIADYSKTVSEGSVRWDIFNRRNNGLEKSGAVQKVDGAWYVWPRLYFGWKFTRERQ